jgi:lysozyme
MERRISFAQALRGNKAGRRPWNPAMHSFYLNAIRNFEGYAPQATWDYAQLSNGFGTKARFAGEVISPAEAERRFRSEVSNARSIVEKAAPQADEGTKAALTSLTYNAGTAWIDSGLGDAVRRGDLSEAREIFQKYTKAGGEVLPGLVSRRAQEALWIGNPDAAAIANASSAGETAGQDSLPPVVLADAGQTALATGSAMRAGSVPSDGVLHHSDGSGLERGPRAEPASRSEAMTTLASNALAAVADLDRLAGGNVSDIARLANLKRGSELARPDQDRDRRDRDTLRV